MNSALLSFCKFSAFVAATLFLLALMWLRTGLFQEPPATVFNVAKLEASREAMVHLSEKEFLVRVQLLPLVFEALNDQSGAQGIEQFGSTFNTLIGNHKTNYDCRMYSSRYQICRKVINTDDL